MVAISIDKYIAIMYPMRPRMLKTQAKIIILVIWSAALLTCLPMALLTKLVGGEQYTPPSATFTSSSSSSTNITSSSLPSSNSDTFSAVTLPSLLSTEANHLSQSSLTSSSSSVDVAQKLTKSTSTNNTTTSTTTTTIPALTTLYENSSATKAEVKMTTRSPLLLEAEQQEQKKLFCEEIWSFWPAGKYYYSMALMILQFVLPLFVLVITYTRIVIIVWGKRMPGEEDNARDARMARSKRKVNILLFSS